MRKFLLLRAAEATARQTGDQRGTEDPGAAPRTPREHLPGSALTLPSSTTCRRRTISRFRRKRTLLTELLRTELARARSLQLRAHRAAR